MVNSRRMSSKDGERLVSVGHKEECPDNSSQRTTVSQIFGEIVWVMSQSATHKHFAIADLEWLVMPPILLNQYKVFRAGEKPVAVALWAKLSADAESRLKDGMKAGGKDFRFAAREWNSGDRLWLVELICIGTGPAMEAVKTAAIDDIRANVFRDQSFSMAVNVGELPKPPIN